MKVCPRCEASRLRARYREFPVNIIDHLALPRHNPSRSSRNAWWKVGPIHKLLVVTPESPWALTTIYAACLECQKTDVYKFVRQVPRYRQYMFALAETGPVRLALKRIDVLHRKAVLYTHTHSFKKIFQQWLLVRDWSYSLVRMMM